MQEHILYEDFSNRGKLLTKKLMAMTTSNPAYLISTKGARRMWPVSKGCLLLRGTWSYLCICRVSVLPYVQFYIYFLKYDYIVNFANLYCKFADL
jgi:hypothetical protein